MTEQISFPLFKGLQKPLEFMGLRGRFIYLAGGAFGGAFGTYVIGNLIGGTIVAIFGALIVGGGLLGYLFVRQRKGLYNRKKFNGIVIYRGLRKDILK